MHKQQKRVLNHLQILRIAVGFSGKSRKIVTQKSVHALDGICVCFSSEMFGRVDEIVGMPMVRCIKFCINMANFIYQFLKAFCFSSSDLKANKPLCSAIYCGPEPDVFLKFMHNSSSSKTSTFSSFLGSFSNFAPAFFTQFMTETWLTLRILSILLKPFPSKYSCIAFRLICSGYPRCSTVQWHLHSLHKYRCFLLLNPLFTRLSLPHFGHLSSLFIHSFYTVYRILAMPIKRGEFVPFAFCLRES